MWYLIPFWGPTSYPSEGLKQRAVTNAELRWVYRHREFNEVSEYIQFWKKEGSVFVPCTPPWSWSVGGGDWAQYKPKNVTWGLAGMRMMEENFKKLLHKNENLRKYYEWLESWNWIKGVWLPLSMQLIKEEHIFLLESLTPTLSISTSSMSRGEGRCEALS